MLDVSSSWNNKETKGMILDTATLRTLIFQFNPISIKDTYKPKYTDHVVPGLRFPRSQWIAGSNRILEFSLEWFFNERTSLGVRNNCEFLQTFLHPDFIYSSKLVKAPRILLFKFGKMYNGYFEMRKCDVTFDTIWEQKTLLARKAKCEISLKFAQLDSPEQSVTSLSNKKIAGTKTIKMAREGTLDYNLHGTDAKYIAQEGSIDTNLNGNSQNIHWESEDKMESTPVLFGSTLGFGG